MVVTNKFWEVTFNGQSVTLRLLATGAVMTVTNEEADMLFNMLSQVYG